MDDSLDEVAGDPSDDGDGGEELRGGQPRYAVGDRGGQPRYAARGPLRIFCVVADVAGFWAGQFEGDAGDGVKAVVGVVLARSFHFRGPSEDVDDQTSHMHTLAATVLRSGVTVHGYIDYPIEQAAALDEAYGSPVGTIQDVMAVLAPRLVRNLAPFADASESLALGDLVRRWQDEGALPPVFAILAPPLAWSVVKACSMIMHSVALTRKVHRGRLFVSTEPSSKRCRTALLQLGRRVARLPKSRKMLLGQLPADLVLDYLIASRDLKALKKTARATLNFARLFSKVVGMEARELVGRLTPCGPELLRRGRVRLDAVCMLLSRDLFERMMERPGPSPSIHIFCDASPLPRGVELFVASWDWVQGDTLERRLFPMVRLSKRLLGAAGKLAGLLWQIFLVSGKNLGVMMSFMGRVRSLTTDMGVERLLADQPNMLRRFLRHAFGNDYSDGLFQIGTHMFANAVHIPGWRHLFDGVLRRALFSLRWFPKFLEQLKALVSFFRDSNAVDDLAEHMAQANLHGLASAIKALRLVGLAEWRWATLGRACKALRDILDSLATHFDPTWIGKVRDTRRAHHVRVALCGDWWMPRYELVMWLAASYVDPILNWIGGCSCHEDQVAEGFAKCMRKGRRLREAHGFAMQSLRHGLETATAWTADDYGQDMVLLQEAQGAARLIYDDGKRRVDLFNHLPWLCARLAEPGVKARCLELWAAHAPEAHHRVSVSFLSPEGGLRGFVDLIEADGGNIHPELQSSIDSLCACPMDDTAAEGPHSIVKRIKTAASASNFAWLASTARLEQNIGDADGLDDRTESSLQSLWDSHTSVLRSPGAHANFQPLRMSRKVFEQRLYNPSRLSGFVDDGGSNEDDDDEGGGDGDDQAAETEQHRTRRTLLKEFIMGAFRPHSYGSVPKRQEGDGPIHLAFYQVLDVGTKGIFVDFLGSDAKRSGNLMCSLQPLEVWSLAHRDGVAADAIPDSIDVFPLEEPARLDLLGLTGLDLAITQKIHVWTSEPSDVDGCIALKGPQLARPPCDPMDAKAPVLVVLVALRTKGWVGVRRLCRHVGDGDEVLEYDSRAVQSKLAYLQVVLSLPALVAQGCTNIPSNQPQSYYKCLLHFKKPIEEARGAQFYRLMLMKADVDSEPLPKRRRRGPGAEDRDEGARGPGAGAGLARGHPPGDEAPRDVLDEVAGDSSGDAGAGEAEVVEEVAAPAAPAAVVVAPGPPADPRPDHVPDRICGAAVKYLTANPAKGYHSRIAVTCTVEGHSCTKSRSLNLGLDRWGPRAAEYYIGAWLSAGPGMAEAAHRALKPSEAQILAYRDSSAE